MRLFTVIIKNKNKNNNDNFYLLNVESKSLDIPDLR